jgi:methionine synthase I (cobalamin-dependent)
MHPAAEAVHAVEAPFVFLEAQAAVFALESLQQFVQVVLRVAKHGSIIEGGHDRRGKKAYSILKQAAHAPCWSCADICCCCCCGT